MITDRNGVHIDTDNTCSSVPVAVSLNGSISFMMLSYNFPVMYPANSYCRWNFTALNGVRKL